MENTPFGGFSAGLRRPNQFAAVGGILVFGGLAAIFAELEFALRPSVAAEWNRLAAVQIRKTGRSFRRRR